MTKLPNKPAKNTNPVGSTVRSKHFQTLKSTKSVSWYKPTEKYFRLETLLKIPMNGFLLFRKLNNTMISELYNEYDSRVVSILASFIWENMDLEKQLPFLNAARFMAKEYTNLKIAVSESDASLLNEYLDNRSRRHIDELLETSDKNQMMIDEESVYDQNPTQKFELNYPVENDFVFANQAMFDQNLHLDPRLFAPDGTMLERQESVSFNNPVQDTPHQDIVDFFQLTNQAITSLSTESRLLNEHETNHQHALKPKKKSNDLRELINASKTKNETKEIQPKTKRRLMLNTSKKPIQMVFEESINTLSAGIENWFKNTSTFLESLSPRQLTP